MADNINDNIIFDDKSISDLFSDIYRNSKAKKKKIDELIDSIKNLVTDINTASLILPLLNDVLDIGIKNDEQLIKLANVAQRLISNSKELDKAPHEILTDEEKRQLITSYESNKKELESVVVNGIDIDEHIKQLEDKMKLSKEEINKTNQKLIEDLDGKDK